MKSRFFSVMFCLAFAAAAFAQNVKRPESYNYKRGLEAYEQENMNEALEFFNKDVQENPKNAYSFLWISLIRLQNEEYGRALTSAELAVKHMPKKDAEYVGYAYATRAGVYLHLEDTVKALNDFTAAIKANPESSSLYEKRAQIYYEQDKYDLADADYRRMTEIDPGELVGYMGLGRNALEQGRLDDAIAQFNYVIKMDDSYSSGYAFRADAEMKKEMWHEATNDFIAAMKYDWDRKSMYHMNEMKEPAASMMLSKLKIQAAKAPNENKWPYLAGLMYMKDKKYRKAIEMYQEANKIEASPVIYQNIAACYSELGSFEQALANINQAIEMDSTDLEYLAKKANIYYGKGDVKEAIAEWDKVLEAQPEYGYGYYLRGWFKKLSGDAEGAVEDLTTSIVLEPEYSYSYIVRGDIYKKQGKTELANADFNKVIEIEKDPENYSCIHYAYHGLGQDDKAVAAMDSIIARGDDVPGNYYDAACLYSRMENKDMALQYLDKALQMGYSQFQHIDRDYDMDYLRDMKEFKELVKKYKDAHDAAVGEEEDQAASGETVTTEVPFTKENGVCKVKCNINGLPLHFIFDTGASDVTISMVEANFMMKNGYLSSTDVIGNQRYVDANGDISVGTVLNLKNVNFGGLDLNNVRASVVRNQKAPLLLGQSVLGRLGRIEIDNAKGMLMITHRK